MTLRRWLGVAVCCLLALLLCPAHQLQAKEAAPQVDVGAFLTELMALKIDGQHTQLAIWMPAEFFTAAASMSMENFTPADAAIVKELLKPYQVMLVQCCVENEQGQDSYLTEEQVRARAGLLLEDGTIVRPKTKVPEDMLELLQGMKKAMADPADPKGEHMVVLLFPATTDTGKPVVETAKKDQLKLGLRAAHGFSLAFFTWHTPFDTTSHIAPCAKCGEDLSAKWSYCPWCGQVAP